MPDTLAMRRALAIFVLALSAIATFANETIVGSMGGSFAVSDMGAATYAIPVKVPQGINGRHP